MTFIVVYYFSPVQVRSCASNISIYLNSLEVLAKFWVLLPDFSVEFQYYLPLGRCESLFCSSWHKVGVLHRKCSYKGSKSVWLMHCFDLTQSTKSQDRKSESKEKQDILSFDKIKEQRERERQRQREREIRETERRR